MPLLKKFGHVKQFAITETNLTIEIGQGFSSDTDNIDNILSVIKGITTLTKVKELKVKDNQFKLILEK